MAPLRAAIAIKGFTELMERYAISLKMRLIMHASRPCAIVSSKVRHLVHWKNEIAWITARMTCGSSRVLSPTSFQQSDRCRMRCFAPRFSGPQRSRSAAAPPVDRPLLGRARQHWRGMQVDLVTEL